MTDYELDPILGKREIPADFDIHKHIASLPFRRALARQARLVPTLPSDCEIGFVSLIRGEETAIVEISGEGSARPNELVYDDKESTRIVELQTDGYLQIADTHFHSYQSQEYHPIWLLPSLSDIDYVSPITDREGFEASHIVIGFATNGGQEARCLVVHLQNYLDEEMARAYKREVEGEMANATNLTEAQVIELLDSYGIKGEFFSLKRNCRKTEIVFDG